MTTPHKQDSVEGVIERFHEKFALYQGSRNWTHAPVLTAMKNFIRDELTQFKAEVEEEIRKALLIGFLRQWLNEDRITDPKKMVTNEEIEHMLGLATKITNKELEDKP